MTQWIFMELSFYCLMLQSQRALETTVIQWYLKEPEVNFQHIRLS